MMSALVRGRFGLGGAPPLSPLDGFASVQGNRRVMRVVPGLPDFTRPGGRVAGCLAWMSLATFLGVSWRGVTGISWVLSSFFPKIEKDGRYKYV